MTYISSIKLIKTNVMLVIKNVFSELFRETTEGLSDVVKTIIKGVIFLIILGAGALIAGLIIVGAPNF
jgi:hypothetical protein